jgi:hypothetical protein
MCEAQQWKSIEYSPSHCICRRTFCVTLCAALSGLHSGCGSRPSSLAGQIQSVDLGATGSYEQRPLDGVFGAAFLLLEEHYKSLGYAGPPEGYPKTTEEAVRWHRRMPAEWWSSSSIPYELWGRQSRAEPNEVTLPLDVPVRLLRAHLDSAGRFEFNDLPLGRHTLFIRWGKNPDPQNNVSGPYGITIDRRGRTEQVFPVNRFDLIDT